MIKAQVLKLLPGAREEGAKERSGCQRSSKKIGLSRSLKEKRLKEIAQLNASFP